MADNIDVDPAQLRGLAARHDEAADQLRAVPEKHGDIQCSIDSLGPIFGEFREAARDLLERRRKCYLAQADEHHQLAQHLHEAANLWERNEADGAARLRALLEDRP